MATDLIGVAARTVVSQIAKRPSVLLIIRSLLSDKWFDCGRCSGSPKST